MIKASESVVQDLRKHFPVGARVELVQMDDPQAPPIGTMGTVNGVDDTGSILVVWDTGSSLNVVYGVDTCKRFESAFCAAPAPLLDLQLGSNANTEMSVGENKNGL